MGWKAYITDQSQITPAMLMHALNALDTELNAVKNATGITFAQDGTYFDPAVVTVAEGLLELGMSRVNGEYIGAYGSDVALVDATPFAWFLVPSDANLTELIGRVQVAPVATATVIDVQVNAVSIGTFTIPAGSTDLVALSLIGETVVRGDIVTLVCTTASSAEGFVGVLR